MNIVFFSLDFSVERAVCKMLLNEHCQLVLKAKALQGLEKFSIPMDESVQYEITLVKFERVRKGNRIIEYFSKEFLIGFVVGRRTIVK